ncbi:MAG: hypothetical protein KF854_00765 [Nitrospira sp.]|nr:hypothetical protein [Nitrospira sp.]
MNIRQMPHGQWVAFEGDDPHKCKTAVATKSRPKLKAPKSQRPTTGGEDFKPYYTTVDTPDAAPSSQIKNTYKPERDVVSNTSREFTRREVVTSGNGSMKFLGWIAAAILITGVVRCSSNSSMRR